MWLIVNFFENQLQKIIEFILAASEAFTHPPSLPVCLSGTWRGWQAMF
jgi:hypothetical protein